MHGVKGQVKPNHEQPKVQLPEGFIQHPPGDLGIPVVNCAEDAKQDSAYDHIVKVRDDEVGTSELPVKRRGTEHDAGKAGDQKLEQECDAEQHRCLELDFAAPHGAQPVENLDAGRNRDGHSGQHKKCVGVGVHTDGEHVMGPDAHTDERDADGGRDHHGITENGFARKYRNNLRRKRKGRNHQDVHFRMPKDPEKMHPESCGAACLRIEKVSAQIAVDQQHDLRRRERADRDQNQAGHHQSQPRQQRHAAQRHARTSHTQDGGDDIDCGSDAAEAGHQHRDSPVIGAMAYGKCA